MIENIIFFSKKKNGTFLKALIEHMQTRVYGVETGIFKSEKFSIFLLKFGFTRVKMGGR